MNINLLFSIEYHTANLDYTIVTQRSSKTQIYSLIRQQPIRVRDKLTKLQMYHFCLEQNDPAEVVQTSSCTTSARLECSYLNGISDLYHFCRQHNEFIRFVGCTTSAFHPSINLLFSTMSSNY